MRSKFILFSLIFWLPACSDIFEKDISDQEITLVAPYNGFISDNSSVTFHWKKIEDASSYNFQLAKPAFSPDKIVDIIRDTNVTASSITLQLNQGQYEWAVYARNSFSQTAQSIYSITIDSSVVPSLIALSPTHGEATKDTSVTFSWNSNGEYEYIFNVSHDAVLVYTDQLSAYTSLTLPKDDSFFLDEGTYQWTVQARDNIGQVSELISRSFIIDRTAPAKPILLSPDNDSTAKTTPVSLEWQKDIDQGSELFDSLYISTDSSFTTLAEAVKIINRNTFDFAPPSDGIYYWKVITNDKAGNKSNYSNTQFFYFNAE